MSKTKIKCVQCGFGDLCTDLGGSTHCDHWMDDDGRCCWCNDFGPFTSEDEEDD